MDCTSQSVNKSSQRDNWSARRTVGRQCRHNSHSCGHPPNSNPWNRGLFLCLDSGESMGNIFMSSKLRIIFTHAAPYETEYGNNYRYQSHRFTGGTAPGADQYIIKEGTRRSEQLREPDFLCIISPVANGGDADRGQRQQTDQA